MDVAARCAGSAEIVKVNADDNPELSIWYNIQSIPTLLFFRDGLLQTRVIGTASSEAILASCVASPRARQPSRGPLSKSNDHEPRFAPGRQLTHRQP